MLTISRPLSARQAGLYHAQEFRNARENYYTIGEEIRGDWHGQLAREWGLSGGVSEEHFQRLANGHHPVTDEVLVRHQKAHIMTNAQGESVHTMEHRAGWDATFSAPKSVSLTALVGGDERVRVAHQESVRIALDETERFVQARLGNIREPETTGRWIAATFEHDSARPVDGYAAAQLHTHAVFFNVTRTDDDRTYSIQPREIFKSQRYATAVYRAELASRLIDLGYQIERGASGQPEIQGYTQEYLVASSPRRQQIEERLEAQGLQGAAAAQIAAHQTREPKLDLSHDEVQARHREMARAFGDQPAQVVAMALERQALEQEQTPRVSAAVAVTYARDRNLEREAVVDERALFQDALGRGMGHVCLNDVRQEFESRLATGEFVEVERALASPARAFTTHAMINLEQETILAMRAGQGQYEAIATPRTVQSLERDQSTLSERQQAVVEQVLSSRDQVLALDGVAGAGKTTVLAVVRDAAERQGYQVDGFAPTSKAAQQLAEAGIPSVTLQGHLIRRDQSDELGPHLYVLDESSLASTKQMHALVQGLEENDRLLLVGDVRQHQAVEAGRPYEQLQAAGMETAHLDDIVRQRDQGLKAVVEQLSHGEVGQALRQLDSQGRVHEIASHDERLAAIARDYVHSPERTLVVSPDNQSRREINEVIHRERQIAGQVEHQEHPVRVLVPRQELTGADRQWAARYDQGDVVRYSTGSQMLGVAAGEYVRVEQIDASQNHLTVARDSGEQLTYDPRRLQGVTVYRESERAFAVGDRVQVTAPDQARHLANRELGTVERMDPSDAKHALHVRLDSGQAVAFERDQSQHLDYGYAVTSHSSQGQTADRVLAHIDTDRGGEALVNRRFAYVALSRSRFDAQVYTNDKAELTQALGREHGHQSALEHAVGPTSEMPELTKSHKMTQSISHGFSH
jgi:conjugative relaxase-like TrwC/TraI family protein